MIKSTIQYINSQLSTLDIFSKPNELTTQIRKLGKVYPGIYEGNEIDEINLDFSLASVYHRMTGEIEVEQTEDDTTGCDEKLTETYPMRLVCYFPKTAFDNDAYVELKVANNIKKVLANSNILSVANDFGLYSVETNVKSLQTDAFEVWKNEFDGIDFRVPSSYCLISIDYDIILTGNLTCFHQYVCE